MNLVGCTRRECAVWIHYGIDRERNRVVCLRYGRRRNCRELACKVRLFLIGLLVKRPNVRANARETCCRRVLRTARGGGAHPAPRSLAFRSIADDYRPALWKIARHDNGIDDRPLVRIATRRIVEPYIRRLLRVHLVAPHEDVAIVLKDHRLAVKRSFRERTNRLVLAIGIALGSVEYRPPVRRDETRREVADASGVGLLATIHTDKAIVGEVGPLIGRVLDLHPAGFKSVDIHALHAVKRPCVRRLRHDFADTQHAFVRHIGCSHTGCLV